MGWEILSQSRVWQFSPRGPCCGADARGRRYPDIAHARGEVRAGEIGSLQPRRHIFDQIQIKDPHRCAGLRPRRVINGKSARDSVSLSECQVSLEQELVNRTGQAWLKRCAPIKIGLNKELVLAG